MKKIGLYFLIAILSFGIFLVVRAPASPLLSLVKNDIYERVPDFSISKTQGTIWSGQSDLQYRKFPSSSLTWQLEALSLVERKVNLDLLLNGDFHELQTKIIAELNTDKELINIESLNGTIESDFINPVSEDFGLTFSGEIDITDLNFQFSKEVLYLANGHINWAGGEIISRTLRDGTQIYQLPALQGDFSLNPENAGLQLNIHQENEQGQNFPDIIQINLKPDGWVVVEIKAGIFALAGLSWGGELSDTAFEYEEKLF